MSIFFESNSIKFSLRNAHSLAICADLAYDSAAEIKTRMTSHGFGAEFIQRRDVQAFIAYNDNAIILSFRGTSSIEDWMTNSAFGFTSFAGGLGKVHRGFSEALYLVWDDIIKILGRVQTKAQPIWITGHSLGGALAALAAAHFALVLDKPIRGVYTFGQPRVGDREYSRNFEADLKGRVFRFVNNSDIVTRIPTRIMSYSHVGALRFFDAKGDLHDDVSYWQEFLETVKGTFDEFKSALPDNIEDHLMKNYIRLIAAKL
jgi:triacylglycerol lipase